MIQQIILAGLLCGLAAADAPDKGRSREEALKLCRTLGGAETGEFWFEHGDKDGPYHHAGRLILSPGGCVSYAVAEPNGELSETGLDVPDEAAELHMDFFTGKSGHGWVVTHCFKPEVKPTAVAARKDHRSACQQALGPAAEFAIANGNLALLKALVGQGLELNEYLDFNKQTTALSSAVWDHQLEIAKYLIAKGANKEMRGAFGERPIKTAFDLGLKDFCKLLAKPDVEEKKIFGVPEGLLEEVFAKQAPRNPMFLRWQGEDPPQDLLTWLKRSHPEIRPASRMETLQRRPLGASSWYRDKTDGAFGTLWECSIEASGEGWKVRIRDTTGPSLAGGGIEAQYTKHCGYWMGKTLTSWDE